MKSGAIKCSLPTSVPLQPLGQRLKAFRAYKGLSQRALAEVLQVPHFTIARWEAGTSRPDNEIAKALIAMGFGEILANELGSRAVSRTKLRIPTLHRELEVTIGEVKRTISPAPWANNGPIDQRPFHELLIQLQTESHFDVGELARRFSLVEAVENFGPTAQNILENPKATAASWNSNYGPHGWHRYVGRFPPHLVRALLNHFGANEKTVVCDPFCGSGTTAVECRLLGIPFVGIEICSLSALMSRVKAGFPFNTGSLTRAIADYNTFYLKTWTTFLKGRKAEAISVAEILRRKSNLVPEFANIEKWLTPRALLGISITIEFASSLKGFSREALFLALSARMRSIGNLDVDVVRAEYSKEPRKNVDVLKLVSSQLKKMVDDIESSVQSHQGLLSATQQVKIIEDSALDVDLGEGAIDIIVTSPPYGVEAISYLRTHLLSYRTMIHELNHDPYATRDKTIGSEYLEARQDFISLPKGISPAFDAWKKHVGSPLDAKLIQRFEGMQKFFSDMAEMAIRMARWLKDDGHVAFVIGNKKLGDEIIPTDTIVTEIFATHGLQLTKVIRHKLKTNNSNSEVPWQDRIIQEEAILMFRREPRVK